MYSIVVFPCSTCVLILNAGEVGVGRQCEGGRSLSPDQRQGEGAGLSGGRHGVLLSRFHLHTTYQIRRLFVANKYILYIF